MSESPKKSSDYKVSALDKALKLIMDIYAKIRHFLGEAIIDCGMRRVLGWYDKNHPDSSRVPDEEDRARINELLRNIKLLDNSIEEREETIAVLRIKEANLLNQAESLKGELTRIADENRSLEERCRNANSQIAELKVTVSLLERKVMPETDIPSMIYYAQGDASGLGFRKISTKSTPHHLYKITTLPGNRCEATFSLISEGDMQDIIENRSLTLIVCEIISIGPAAKSIQVIEAGRAVYKNNKWIVTNKAKVKLK